MNIPASLGVRTGLGASETRLGSTLQQSQGIGEPSPKAKRAAQELEAQLLGDWLQNLQKAFSGTGGEGDPAVGENYRYLTTQALAQTLAAHGGLGIGKMLLHSLHLQPEKNSAPEPKAGLPHADSNH